MSRRAFGQCSVLCGGNPGQVRGNPSGIAESAATCARGHGASKDFGLVEGAVGASRGGVDKGEVVLQQAYYPALFPTGGQRQQGVGHITLVDPPDCCAALAGACLDLAPHDGRLPQVCEVARIEDIGAYA